LLCACSLDQSACPGKQPMKNLTRKTWFKWGAPSFTVFLRFFQHSRGRLCHSLHCGQNIHPTSGVIKSSSQLCSLQMHSAPILFPTSVRSKLHLHLLSNPDCPIAHTMKLGLASRSRFQGADRQPLSRFLHASQGCARDGSHRTWLMRQSQTGFLPAHVAGLSSIYRRFSRHPLQGSGSKETNKLAGLVREYPRISAQIRGKPWVSVIRYTLSLGHQ